MASMHGLENKAAWVVESKGAVKVGPAEMSKPEKGEVLIRVGF